MLAGMTDDSSIDSPSSTSRGERPRIILDCDPGHDDVVAIIVARAHTDLVGVTTVAGNAPLDRTTHNACVIRDTLDLGCGVHSGAERPLVGAPKFGGFVHGASGLDGADLPPPQAGPDSRDAVAFIIDSCRTEEGLWLVPTGPLTNIALALRAAPDLAGRIAGISLMGGGSYGNRTPVAEFNIWADPEAAAIVFACGAPVTMAGLDVTHQFLVTHPRVDEVRAIGTPFTDLLADLFRYFADNYISRHDAMEGAALHDPLAVLALTHPHLFDATERHVAVETSGRLTAGMTVIDRRSITDRPPPNARVLERVDSDGAWAVVLAALVCAGRWAAS